MRKLPLVLFAAGAYLLNGCAVYMPMQCAAPAITGPRQAQLTGSIYSGRRAEIAATYSPVRHLLLRAATGSRSGDPRDSTYYRSKQYELGVGTYFKLTDNWLVGGLAGYGWARNAARYEGNGGASILRQLPQHEFEMRYGRTSGEVYTSFQATETLSFGGAYRLNYVQFRQLTNRGTVLNLRTMTRSEPMLFMRSSSRKFPALQFQLAAGQSTTWGYRGMARQSDSNSQIQRPRGYLSLSISLLPHLLPEKLAAN